MGGDTLDIGATPGDGGVSFRVWAPMAESMAVELVDYHLPAFALKRDGEYFEGSAPARPGDRYWYWLDGTLRRPDPASRFQPDGVHGPSQVVDPSFEWGDDGWQGILLEKGIFYELHIGTFTADGSFEAAIGRLDYLQELGITAIELMPVAQFPGTRNWGYDGTFPFAPQNSYGGPVGLKRLVDACHARGMAVVLDVVYNHLGPEGNYLHAFGPYFTDRYRTPWGDAVNFDGPYSDQVRNYFIANALYWITEFHVDALRLDAIHGIFDFSACHILKELNDAVSRQARELGRQVHLIAESDLNDVRIITPVEKGGYGLAAQWNDDFHHSLRTLLTKDRRGYYADFGSIDQLAKAYREGFVMNGTYSSFRHRRHGNSSADRPSSQLVVSNQNHDQVGNRMRGERLQEHLTPAQLRLAAAAVLLSPNLPLLFMGEEYAEPSPFPYFISHGDPELVAAVRRGREEEFAAFAAEGEVPDPQAESTFRSAIMHPELCRKGEHAALFAWYKSLIRLRKHLVAKFGLDRDGLEIIADPQKMLLTLKRVKHGADLFSLLNFSADSHTVTFPDGPFRWGILLNSSDEVSFEEQQLVDSSEITVAPYGVMVCQKH